MKELVAAETCGFIPQDIMNGPRISPPPIPSNPAAIPAKKANSGIIIILLLSHLISSFHQGYPHLFQEIVSLNNIHPVRSVKHKVMITKATSRPANPPLHPSIPTRDSVPRPPLNREYITTINIITIMSRI